MVKITEDIENAFAAMDRGARIMNWICLLIAITLVGALLFIMYQASMKHHSVALSAPWPVELDGDENVAIADYRDVKPLDINYEVFHVLPRE